jgi:hypothetical protein
VKLGDGLDFPVGARCAGWRCVALIGFTVGMARAFPLVDPGEFPGLPGKAPLLAGNGAGAS